MTGRSVSEPAAITIPHSVPRSVAGLPCVVGNGEDDTNEADHRGLLRARSRSRGRVESRPWCVARAGSWTTPSLSGRARSVANARTSAVASSVTPSQHQRRQSAARRRVLDHRLIGSRQVVRFPKRPCLLKKAERR